MNDIGIIHLTGKRGGFAIVNADLFERFNRYRWRLNKDGYVVRSVLRDGKPTIEYLHIEIKGRTHGFEIDHKNGFKIDCMRRNLRWATRTQNTGNSRKQPGRSSSFKGVSWHARRAKWTAQIHVNYRKKHLGVFDSEVAAARAYDAAALEVFGKFSKLNNK